MVIKRLYPNRAIISIQGDRPPFVGDTLRRIINGDGNVIWQWQIHTREFHVITDPSRVAELEAQYQATPKPAMEPADRIS